MKDDLEKLIKNFSSKFGEAELERVLKSKLASSDNVLTVIADDTLHKIPAHVIQGETFVFSSGNFDTSSAVALTQHIEARTILLHERLNSKNWSRIRLIFSGHAILAATAKLVIYRVTHIETEDVLYFGSSGYMEVTMRFRQLIGDGVP